MRLPARGHLGDDAGTVLERAVDHVTDCERVLMIDVYRVVFMDPAGLLHLLDLHRRAECLGLRVLVVGWQPQPQELMARSARIPGPGPAPANTMRGRASVAPSANEYNVITIAGPSPPPRT
ncbi:STAS domain-containing protein [Streptomyces sp. NPDC058290]|uniref:STAS domain-containing protein n=1 Tax=Streptomyces sp. NPDC058290 TaxID=3346426 RepID=UPI0036E5D5BE